MSIYKIEKRLRILYCLESEAVRSLEVLKNSRDAMPSVEEKSAYWTRRSNLESQIKVLGKTYRDLVDEYELEYEAELGEILSEVENADL